MSMIQHAPLARRPEIEIPLTAPPANLDVERRLPFFERLWSSALFRRAALLLLIALVWQVYAWRLNNSLMFPPFSKTIAARATGCKVLSKVGTSDHAPVMMTKL